MRKLFFTVIFALITANSFSQWVNQNIIPPPPPMNSVHVYNSSVIWACGDSGKIVYTSNGGQNWLIKTSPLFQNFPVYSIQALNDSTALCICNVSSAGIAGKIFKSTNRGTTWFQVFSRSGLHLNDLKMVDALTGYAYANPVGNQWFVMKILAGGNFYDTTLGRPAVASPNDIGFPNALTVMNNAGQHYIWFGTSATRIYYSSNGGINWNFSSTAGNSSVFGITFSNTLTGFAGGQNAIVTTVGGSVWSPQPMPGTGNINAFDNAAGSYWCARGNSIYYSPNFGSPFVLQHTSPDNSTYIDLSFSTISGDMSTIVGCGVTSNGVLSIYTNNQGITQLGMSIPLKYNLEQNYPNPFNPSTKIRFDIPKSGNVSLILFDITGRKVESIYEGRLNAGVYSADYDASKLASGMYFYTLVTNEFSETRKMILVK